MSGAGAGKIAQLEAEEAKLKKQIDDLDVEIAAAKGEEKKTLREERLTKEKLRLSIREERLKLEGAAPANSGGGGGGSAAEPTIEALSAGMKKLAVSGDVSANTVKELVDLNELKELPPIGQLKAFLSTPLRKQIFSGQPFLPELKDEVVYDPAKAAMARELSLLIDRVIAPPPVYAGEAGMHGFIDSLITNPLKLFSGFVSVDMELPKRDATDQSVTAQRKRPDLLVYVEDVLVLRGEEKSEDFKTARAELTEKLVISQLFTGGLPYVFGMAANKQQLQLFALPMSGDKTAVPITDLLTVAPEGTTTHAADRLVVFRSMVNLFRLFRMIHGRVPRGIPHLYDTLTRDDGKVTVYFDADCVIKRLPLPGHYHSDLKDLYGELKTERSEHLMVIDSHTIHAATNTLKLRLKTVGAELKPQLKAMTVAGAGASSAAAKDSKTGAYDERELKTAIRCVLKGLQVLHKLGFTHNDIRWPNVLVHNQHTYFLIDFEMATRMKGAAAKDEARLFSVAADPELKANPHKPYDVQSDLWMVGRLLLSAYHTTELSKEAIHFAEHLTVGVSGLKPRRCESVTDALNHIWLRQ